MSQDPDTQSPLAGTEESDFRVVLDRAGTRTAEHPTRPEIRPALI